MFQSYYYDKMTVLPTSILSTENSIRAKLIPEAFMLFIGGVLRGTTRAGGVGALTCVEVSVCERLQDAVHGPHVEQEAKLRDAHGDQAEQEGRGGDGFEERLGCGGQADRVKGSQTFVLILTHSAFLHSAWGLQSISRSVVERQSLFPSLAARSFCLRLLPTLRRRPTVVTWW